MLCQWYLSLYLLDRLVSIVSMGQVLFTFYKQSSTCQVVVLHAGELLGLVSYPLWYYVISVCSHAGPWTKSVFWGWAYWNFTGVHALWPQIKSSGTGTQLLRCVEYVKPCPAVVIEVSLCAFESLYKR